MTQTARRRVIWGLSLHGWEEMMRWSLAAAGIAALIVGVSTYFVVSLQREELARSKDEFDRYKIEASQNVASARSDADAKIAIAREESSAEIAKANARSDEANARALEAQLALEKFKSPRVLNPEQQERISEKLKPFGVMPFDFSVSMGDEPTDLLEQISSSLEAAG